MTDVGKIADLSLLSKRDENFYWFEHRAHNKIKNLEGQRELGKAGSIALCNNTVCLHRQGLPLGKKRHSSALVYAPKKLTLYPRFCLFIYMDNKNNQNMSFVATLFEPATSTLQRTEFTTDYYLLIFV